MKSSNKIVANAMARNAKFNVGDYLLEETGDVWVVAQVRSGKDKNPLDDEMFLKTAPCDVVAKGRPAVSFWTFNGDGGGTYKKIPKIPVPKHKVGDVVSGIRGQKKFRGKIVSIDRAQYKFEYLYTVKLDLAFKEQWGGSLAMHNVSDSELVADNSRATNAKFKVGDRVWFSDKGKKVPAEVTDIDGTTNGIEITPTNEEEAYTGDPMWTNESCLKTRNSVACNSRNPVVMKALNAEYVIRKAFTPGKWLLSRKTTSLGDMGETKAFSSESEAREYAKKNGLKVINSTFINLYHIPWDGADENERSGYWFKYQGKNYGPFKSEQEARRFQKQNSSKVPFPLMTASSDSKPFGSSVKETNETKPWGMRMPMPNAVARNGSDDYKIEKIRTSQGDRWVVIGKPGRAIRLQFPTLDEAVAYKLKVSNSIAKNELNPEAEVKLEDVSDKFEVGKNYQAPWDRNWFCRVISRTATSIKVATKSKNQRGWGPRDEWVTLRINKRKSIEQDGEVAVGQGWEFWASERA